MTFFPDRSPRERLLIAIMLGLALLMALWFLLLKPVMDAGTNAADDHRRAVRDYQVVQDGLPYLGRVQTDRQAFDRSALIRTARDMQINISRVQPENDGDIKIWFDDAQSQQVFGFLNKLLRTYDTEVEAAQFNRRPDGKVSAQITFAAP